MAKADNFFVVALWSSEPSALTEFFGALPSSSGMAYVVLAQDERSALTKTLKTLTGLPVSEVKRTVSLKPNRVYVISSGLTVANGKLKPVKNGTPSIDSFFRSLAEDLENRLVGVLLDKNNGGTLGLRYVKEHWGITLAPEAEESTNTVDIAVPVSEMPQRLLALGETSSKLGPLREKIALLESEPTEPPKEQQMEVSGDGLSSILDLLKEQTGHDFGNYKHPTLLRRIARRLQVHELADMAGYVDFMRKRPEEIKGLLSDLLISVTNFFRDEEAFEALRLELIPQLFAGKTSSDTVRVWSCGCATGEEAYSLAMLFSEYTSTLSDAPPFQIFASDINEEAVRTAREGYYSEKDVQGVSEERLGRFFVREEKGYRVKKEIRDMVLFAVHNVLRDPPFSRLELIVCRNLLIYLNRETQEKVLKLFQFSLRPRGYLFLGSSESVESASGLFSTLDKHHRLYQSRATATSYGASSVMPSSGKWEVKIPDLATRPIQQRASYGELHYKLLESLAPPSILVNEDDNIVHVSESAGRFLRVSGGEPTRQLFQALHPGLKLETQRALFEAKKGTGIGISRGVPFRLEGQDTAVTVTVRFVKLLETYSTFYLVLFEKGEADPQKLQVSPSEPSKDTFVLWLEEELQASRDSLRMTVEQYETSAEELRASNEELQALNEELRAASEELETSKEELQSLNEELMTMIDDQKRTELALRESQYRFSIASEAANIGIHDYDVINNRVFWDEKIRLLWGVGTEEDITYQTFAAGLHRDDLATTQMAVDKALDPLGNGHYYAEYRVINRRDGKVRWVAATGQTFFENGKAVRLIGTAQDISERKRSEEALRASKEELERQSRLYDTTLSTIHDYVYNFDREGKFLYANQILLNLWGIKKEEVVGKTMADLNYPKEVEAKLLGGVREVFATGKTVKNETFYTSPDGRGAYFENILSPFFALDGSVEFVSGTSRDVSERRRMEETLRQQTALLNNVNDNTTELIFMKDLQGRLTYANAATLEAMGLTLEEAIGSDNGVRFYNPAEAPPIDANDRHVAETGETIVVEETYTRADGEQRVFLSTKSPLREETGKVVGIIGVSRDITERKQVEEALRQQQKFTEGILEAAPSLIYIYDLQAGRNTFISLQSASVLGYTPEEIQALGSEVIQHLLHPDDAKAVAERFENTLSSASDDVYELEYRMKHKNGSWVWLLSRDKVFARDENGRPTHLLGVATQISERKEAEVRLERSERELRLITDAMPALISYIDKEFRYRLANKTYLEWFGIEFKDIIGKTMSEVLGEEAFALLRPHVEAAFSGQTQTFETEVPYKHGGTRYIYAIYTPNVQNGEVAGVFIHVLDISERKRQEEALQESEEKYRTLFNSMDEGYTLVEMIFDTDKTPLDYRFVQINPTFSAQTGLPQESVGKTALELVPGLEPFWIETYGRVALTGEAVRFENYAEAMGRWFDVYALRVGAASEGRVGILFRNVTERKRHEQNLAFLAEVVEDLSRSTLLQDIMKHVGEKVGDFLNVPYCHFMAIDEANDEVIYLARWNKEGVLRLPDKVRLSEHITEDFRKLAHAGETIVSNDTGTNPITKGEANAAINAVSFITVPFLSEGEWKYQFSVHDVRPREWREDEIDLVRELANRIFPRLERAKAEAALRDSEEKYRAITELSSHMVWTLAPDGEITYLSQKWLEYTGLSEEEIYKTGWLEVLHPDDRDRITAEFQEALAKGEPYAMELRLKNKKGDYYWHLTRAVPIKEGGKLVRWLGVTFDIQEQKGTEAKLREADKRKDEFLATLGHELRNPLAPIRMGVELMKRSDDPDILREARDIIARQSEQLNHLLDDLLDVSRISRGIVVLQKEKVDLAEVVGLAVESARPLLEDRNHTLSVTLPETPFLLNADKTRLTQIILNLLTNAAKYTNPGGEIALRTKAEQNEVLLSVQDNGIGIPREMLNKVFDMFTRLERKESYQQQGLGIGLNLVRQLAELHGGSIEAASPGEGQGSTFTLCLPLGERIEAVESVQAQIPPPQTIQSQPTPSRRVLVVDDYAANLKTLSRMLRLAGHEVATAERGELALELLETFKPEVILLDINMPGLSGYEVATQIRAKASHEHLKLVALTGYGQAEDVERTKAAGFDDHLVKPVDLVRLEEVLAT
jgi:two-component system, chemotaxis family, CheB/CheR fusion protein